MSTLIGRKKKAKIKTKEDKFVKIKRFIKCLARATYTQMSEESWNKLREKRYAKRTN